MKFKLTALVLLVFALSACAPALPAPTPTATLVPPTLTPIPEKTPTPTETPLADGTLIPVDTTKEGWISEFPGLEEAVKVDAEGNGTLTMEGRDFGYHSKDTIFKIAGKNDILWVAGWEYKRNEDTQEYEYSDVIRVLAPRWTKDADGNDVPPVDRKEIAPHINELQDPELLAHFLEQTANMNAFDEMDTKRNNIRTSANHYKAKPYDNGIYLLPISDEGDVRYANSKDSRFSADPGSIEPIIYGNDTKSTIFNLKFLDFKNQISISPLIATESEYEILAKHLNNRRHLMWLLYKQVDPTDFCNKKVSFLAQNTRENEHIL